jgi:HTH-type transcriptional regulator/antitoxin HigA
MRNTARKIGVNSPLNTIFIMNISPIRTPEDHQRALARVSALMKLDPEPGTPKSDELEVLAQMVELYEKKRFDLGEPEPLDLIAFAMEQQGLTKKDMVPYLGSPSRVSEVLSGKRSLTLLMIYKLHTGLGLPLHPLVLGVVRPKRVLRPKQASPARAIGTKRQAKPALRMKQRILKTQTA